MPATYEIDKKRRLVITMGLGRVTLAEAMANQERLSKEPDFDPSYSQLMDVTRADLASLTANDIRTIAERNVFSPESRRAIVVSSNLGYGFGRMFETLREIAGEKGVRIFRDLDEAVDWLLSNNAAGA